MRFGKVRNSQWKRKYQLGIAAASALCLWIAHLGRSIVGVDHNPTYFDPTGNMPITSRSSTSEVISLPDGNHTAPIQSPERSSQSEALDLTTTNPDLPLQKSAEHEAIAMLPLSVPSLLIDSTSISDMGNLPWRLTAPNIDTSIPLWMEDYVKFHNDSLHNAHQQTKDTDANKYLIFSCKKSCSGTGNRQRAIMASFIVAIITKRIFLIDITFPVQLELILQPYRIRWNHFPPHLDALKSKVLKLRNKHPPALDSPSKFTALSGFAVLRVEANSPVNLEQQWRSQEVRKLLTSHGDGRGVRVPGNLYKQIFATLYRPSPALTTEVSSLREQLKLSITTKTTSAITTSSNATTSVDASSSSMRYIVLHARTGGDGVGWKDEDRFTKDKLDNLYGNALMVRRGMLQSSASIATNETLPIVIVSDDARAKKTLYDKDPTVMRYADTKIIHVDRSKRAMNDLEGSLAVWADILIMAEASCIVKGRGSFSMLGAWLASKGIGPACMHLVI